MGNSYFQFKQFRIEQGETAMKVSTDACIQGAWTPITFVTKRALDIGTGTGLLSLMLAQRNKNVIIDALEIDPKAAEQARENVALSPWKERLNVVEADARSFESTEKYDMAICNPPFFSNSLLGPDIEKNIARHGISLSLEELFYAIKSNLTEEGYASVLLPLKEHSRWEQILNQGKWQIFHQLNIVSRVGSRPNRVVSLCSPAVGKQVLREDLIIRNRQHGYTPEFIELLRPFYIQL